MKISLMIATICIMAITYGEPYSRNSAFELNAEQLTYFKNQAYGGSKDAAFKVYQYYNFCFKNHPDTIKWLLLAKELGHSTAQQNYMVFKKISNSMSVLLEPRNAFFLNTSQISYLSQLASNGSGEAAFWLYLFYRFCKNDIELAEKWRLIAVNLKIKIADRPLF